MKNKKDLSGCSPEHLKYLKQKKLKKILILGLQIGVLVLFVGLWEILTAAKIMDPFMFSSPSRIAKMFGTLAGAGTIWIHIWTTLYECILGFVISTVIGVLIAVALWWNNTLNKVLDPYIIVLNSLPKVALGPIIIIWAGVGIKSIVTMCVLICIVVTIISVLGGFMSCSKDKVLLLKSMGASKFQVFTKLIFPHSVPSLIGVLKMNIGLSWVGTIMGEYLASAKGLGYLIVYGGQIFQIDLVMTATVILCLLATVMYLGISFVEKRFSR